MVARQSANEQIRITSYNVCYTKLLRVIPLGFDLSKFRGDNASFRSKFRVEYNLNDSDVAIGIIGRLAPVKNHKLFLDAIKVLKFGTRNNFV